MSSTNEKRATTPDDPPKNAFWCYSTDEERWYGRCPNREAAIELGRAENPGESFYVAWAVNDPIQLSEWIQIDDVLERANVEVLDSDRVCFEFEDEDDVFTANLDQEKDLLLRLRRACDQWQDAHDLVFRVNTFSNMGNSEFIEADEEAA